MNGKASGFHVEDFLNPKSMPTPTAAGAVVALIAGALFKGFGLSVALCSIVLSFMIGLIVYQSREFKSNGMSKIAKLILYAINSLIIFALATGATSVMAGEIMTQQRPYFYDWTKRANRPGIEQPGSNRPYDLMIQITPKKSGRLIGLLKDAGVLTKDFSTKITIVPTGNAELDEITGVKLKLPQEYFKNPEVNLTEQQIRNGVNMNLWKGFPIEAEISTSSGETFKVNKYINPPTQQ